MSTAAASNLEAFQTRLPWPLDAYQREAIEKLEEMHGVLVCAPTSSGKTVIAEYCNFVALEKGQRVIYTTPLKALSNQKYRDFCQQYGEREVGLVTGENTVNERAPIVVMTTEILRNVIYEDLPQLDRVSYVILDEVHYIDDQPRGSVWEEVIIQTPTHIKFVSLSATIGNYQQLAAWMAENRGPIGVVFHAQRPVELTLHLGLRGTFYPLFSVNGEINPETWKKALTEEERSSEQWIKRRRTNNDLLDVAAELKRRQLLPAIYFIFSRRGCREALQRCAYHSLDLTTPEEKQAIDKATSNLLNRLEDPGEAELFRRMLDGTMLARGISLHHAGLLPYHKELVEELFQAGLLKLVFATETLSLGINMPAKAVVVSSFTKFNGIDFNPLNPGELTQLMGRAGRRGIDLQGHGIILKEPDTDIETIYEVASGPVPTIESKFLPNYNMALNLLRRHTPEEAEELIARSFGQFQRHLALEENLQRLRSESAQLEELDQRGSCPRCSPEKVKAFFELEQRLQALRIEVRRLSNELKSNPRSSRGGRQRPKALGIVGRQLNRLKIEQSSLRKKQRKLERSGCPDFAIHLAEYRERHRLELKLKATERIVAEQRGGYARQLHQLCQLLGETGFLAGDQPSEKGLLTARVYGENSIVIVEAIWQGLFDQLTSAELCACLSVLTSDDRGRERAPRTARPAPTPNAKAALRQINHLHRHFAELERERGEVTLKPLVYDYLDFAYRWALGEPMDSILLPPHLDIGDAIKAMKQLYSILRQLEFALRQSKLPLHSTIWEALECMEREVIKRT